MSCLNFPQYPGPPAGFADLPYDVCTGPITVGVGAYLPGQAVKIGNYDSSFYLCGVSMLPPAAPAVVSSVKVIVRDHEQRQLQTLPLVGAGGVWLDCVASHNGQQQAMFPELIWPRGGYIHFDLLNVDTGAAAVVNIVFQGFKRYRIGDAPC